MPSPFPIVPPGGEAGALSGLPVEALGLDEETCETLRRLGLKRIGQLHELPRASLARRFREPLASPLMTRLDQALGRAETPLTPLGSRPVFTVREALIEPLVSAEGVAGLVEHLAQAFCARLEKAGRGALRLVIKLYRVDGSRAVIPLGLVQGSHDPRHLVRLIAPRLESIDLGFGGPAGLDAQGRRGGRPGADSGLPIISADNMADAAQKVVAAIAKKKTKKKAKPAAKKKPLKAKKPMKAKSKVKPRSKAKKAKGKKKK